jgi:enamine deaminase RidA (YjgF/YER057c/UK114 family)
MAHRRVRPFNTRDTYPEQRLDTDLAQAVVARGTLVFLRGQAGQDLDTAESVGLGDPEAQTRRAMENVGRLLAECGAEWGHLCKVVVYLTDIRHREAVYRTMGEYLRGVHPVSTGLVVSALARPEWLVEIDATAVIPEERAASARGGDAASPGGDASIFDEDGASIFDDGTPP